MIPSIPSMPSMGGPGISGGSVVYPPFLWTPYTMEDEARINGVLTALTITGTPTYDATKGILINSGISIIAPDPADYIDLSIGAIEVDWAPIAATSTGNKILIDFRPSALIAATLYVNSSMQIQVLQQGVTTTTATLTWVAGTVYRVRYEWDGTTVRIYRNGTQIATTGTAGTMTARNANMYIGQDNTSAQKANGHIARVAINDTTGAIT